MDDQTLSGLRRIPGVSAAYVVEVGRPPVRPQAGDAAGVPGAVALQAAQSALLAAVVSALNRAADDLELGQLQETIVEAERGAVVAGALPGGRAAIVVAESRANLGMIRMELRKLRRGA